MIGLLLWWFSWAFAQNCESTNHQFRDFKSIVQTQMYSQQVAEKLTAAGWTCDSRTQEVRGTRCRGAIPGYPQKVNIYIPRSLQQAALSVNLHFHGYNLDRPQDIQRHFNMKNGDGDYGAFLARSQASSLLVIPESTGNGKDYSSFLGSAKQVNEFLAKIAKVSGTENQKWSMSGHSGAGKVINQILSDRRSLRPGLNSIALFDALYGPHENIQKWVRENRAAKKKFILFDSYISGLYPDGKALANDTWSKEYKRILGGKTITVNQEISEDVTYLDLYKERHLDVMSRHMAIMKNGRMDAFLRAAGAL
ncbi:MAG: hypothetical protein OM95_12860 [Bdellovibrio sp. ArHS]|uniref:hypothetical protein n=1 Tax=Bdellovibrio sp. ArHS TaxID=1569284 RepID=UPI000583C7B9|nr:hypothetical protein [Bdellovibrio sp. ArHS]KHD87709.1 MAG: hypothetical protein OM95_12860 [Bdellovibrio sp. ArHS]